MNLLVKRAFRERGLMFGNRASSFLLHSNRTTAFLKPRRNDRAGGGGRWPYPVSVLLTFLLGLAAAAQNLEPPGLERLSETAASKGFLETFDAVWSIIHDTYFDPTFRGLDWAAVRAELRPKVETARDVEALRAVIEDMVERLGASHMALIPGTARSEDGRASAQAGSTPSDRHGAPGTLLPSEASAPVSAARSDTSSRNRAGRDHDGDAGLEVRIMDGRILVTRVDAGGPAAKLGVKPGWIIDSIDGQISSALLEELRTDRHSRRARFLAWRSIVSQLSGPPGSTVEVQFRNGVDQVVRLQIERQQEQGEATQLGLFPKLYARFDSQALPLSDGGTVGVIRFNLWMIPVVRFLDEKIDQFRTADGIVIDMRGNLGGLGAMILGVSGHFFNDRVSLGTLTMRGAELNFFSNPRRVSVGGQRVAPFAGPVAILIDDLSLSAAEIFAGGMQSVGRARVFGENSGGQALPAVWDRLPNGDVLYHAVGDFVTANGSRLEGQGVLPDEKIVTTRQSLLAGRDDVLQAALRWIQQQKRNVHPLPSASATHRF